MTYMEDFRATGMPAPQKCMTPIGVSIADRGHLHASYVAGNTGLFMGQIAGEFIEQALRALCEGLPWWFEPTRRS